MNDNRKSIGVVFEKLTKKGDKFYAGEINLDEINHAWVYRKTDNRGNQKEKISITLFKNTSKNGKKYWSVSMSPEYKAENSSRPANDEPSF